MRVQLVTGAGGACIGSVLVFVVLRVRFERKWFLRPVRRYVSSAAYTRYFIVVVVRLWRMPRDGVTRNTSKSRVIVHV